MDIKIEGDPGTGNTFMEINIQHVENFNTINPDAVIHNGTRARQQEPSQSTQGLKDIHDEILCYVNRLRTHLSDEWKYGYQRLWEDILDIKIVSEAIYTRGKQQRTNFNRNLVANIIHYLSCKGVYGKSYTAARFAVCLEGDKEHSVRSALGRDPSSDIVLRLDSCLENFDM